MTKMAIYSISADDLVCLTFMFIYFFWQQPLVAIVVMAGVKGESDSVFEERESLLT